MSIPFKDHSVDYSQFGLFPANVFELLPNDHECFCFADLLGQIDTTEIEKNYQSIGQRAYHPKLITSILIYAYSRGVYSSREIQRRCNEDLSFMFIAQQNCPNFRVLSDFRKAHSAFFHDCFVQTVKLAMALKMASLGHISLDGSKFKANTSKHKAMSYQHLEAQEQALSEQIQKLTTKAAHCDQEEAGIDQDDTGFNIPEELKFKEERLKKITQAKEALEAREQALNPDQAIEGKKQISFADTDATIMGKKGSGFGYQYNAQISVDSDEQIIVANHISTQANDTQEVKEGLKQVKESTGKNAEKMSMDNGYYSGDNLQALEDEEVEAYVAINKAEQLSSTELEQSDRRVDKSDFLYNEQDDSFTCPQGRVLVLIRTRKDGRTFYQPEKGSCSNCPLRSRCCNSSKGEDRSISGDVNEVIRQRMKQKMQSRQAKEIYKERKVIVEPVFGQIKNRGFRGFSLRGVKKVAGEFSLVCAVHNLKKIMVKMMAGLIRSENGELVSVG